MLPCCALHLFQQEDNEKWKTPVFIILAYPLMCVLIHWERKRRKTSHCILLASKSAQAWFWNLISTICFKSFQSSKFHKSPLLSLSIPFSSQFHLYENILTKAWLLGLIQHVIKTQIKHKKANFPLVSGLTRAVLCQDGYRYSIRKTN